jgi:type I restriction enzyme S subunit
MEVKPGYKQTEVGVIPEEWDVFSLSELTEPQRPISYGIVQTGPNVANGVSCLRVLDIHEGRINKCDLITTSKGISDSYRRTVLKAGDLVMPLRGKVGDVGLVDEELEGANLTRGVALIAIRSGWSPVFCQQAISAKSTRRRLEQAMNGSALQEIPIASLRSFKIPTPKTLPEQRAIATALSDVDGLLGGLDRLIAKKRDLKQAAMQQLLTGQTRLPGFTGEWEITPLSDLITEFRGGAPLKPSDFTITGIKVLPKGGVGRTGWLQVEADNLQFCSPVYAAAHPHNQVDQSYTIVVLRDLVPSGPSIGLMVLVKEPERYLLAQGVYGFKVNERAEPRYLVQLSSTLWYRRLMNSIMVGSTQVHITNTAFKCVQIPLPTAPEQTAIAEVLSDMDAEIAALEQRRQKTRALKQAMMQELLTGRTRLV